MQNMFEQEEVCDEMNSCSWGNCTGTCYNVCSGNCGDGCTDYCDKGCWGTCHVMDKY